MARSEIRHPRRFPAALAALTAGASLACLSASLAFAGPAADQAPRRLLLRLPEAHTPSRLLRFGDLRAPARTVTLDTGTPLIPTAAGASELLASRGAVGLARVGDGITDAPPEWEDWYVVAFDPPLSRAAAEDLVRALRTAEPAIAAEVEGVYEHLAVEELMRPLSAEPSATRRLGSDFFPNDPLFADGSQWGLWNDGTGPVSSQAGLDVRAPGAWAQTTGNTAIRIGALDTGVDNTHPDLVRTLADGSPRLYYMDVVTDDGSGGKDSHYHGTAVLGVMAALTNNGASLGGLGVAGVMGGSGGDSTGARIFSLKITAGSEDTAAGTDMARAIVLAHQAGARAVNLSFAGVDVTPVVRTALAYVADHGTIVVCGAGNTTNSVLQYPGSYSRFGLTLSVGAMDPTGQLAVFSTRGEQLDVVAPGQDIATTWLTYANAAGSPIRNYQQVAGTSFAAPFVTGALGLVAALGIDLRANDYGEVVRRTARDWGVPGRDTLYGSGLLDVAALLRRVSPPYSFRRGTAAPTNWTAVGRESLSVVVSGREHEGHSVDGAYEADVWEVTVPVTGLTDVLGELEGWVRYTGVGGWSRGKVHEYDYAWGEVVPGSHRSDGFDLRTYAYFVDQPPPDCPTCSPVGWLPRSPAEIQLDWTAWAKFDDPPRLSVLEPAPDAVWTSGETQTVRWEASDPDRVTRVDIDWVAGGSVTRLASSTDSIGMVQVLVPCRRGPHATQVRVTAYDENGLSLDNSAVEVPVRLAGEGCDGSAFFVSAPFPNPARGAVHFSYWLTADSNAPSELKIHDARGRVVARRLLPVRGLPAEISWDGVTADGRRSPSGVYWAVIEGSGGRRSVRFTWIR